MAVGIEAGTVHDARHARAQQRHVLRHGVIGGGGEEAHEPAFAGDAAVLVVRLHDHAVHGAAAVDQRLPVGLHDQELLGPAREARHRGPSAQPFLEQPHLVAPQDAQCRARHDLVADAALAGGIVGVAVAAMAEEREMVGLEPAQELGVLGEFGRASRRQVLDRVETGLAHRPPILDRQPHLGQHAGEGGGQVVEQDRIGLPVDLDMHQRFARRAMARLARKLAQVAVEVAPHRHHRVGEKVHGDFAAIELVGDRIDQERHVVVHDLHDRAPALETVVGEVGIEHPDLGDARQAAAGKGQQGDRGGRAPVGQGCVQVPVGDPLIEAAGKLGGIFGSRQAERRHTDRVQTVGTWGFGANWRGRHLVFLRFRRGRMLRRPTPSRVTI